MRGGQHSAIREMNILGIETSCDETAAAVVKDGREVLSNAVYTQIPLHRPYGGVVPEIASRAHVEKISGVVEAAVKDAGVKIDAVAVTYGAGLSPALIVGLNFAKGLAMSLGVPLIGVNHIEAHLHTPFLFDRGDEAGRDASGLSPETCSPSLGLAVSGGHTNWIDMPEYGKYEIIGQTLDDAAGEAFDKASKLLGLGYPGGPKVDKISAAYFRAAGLDSASSNLSKSLEPFPKGRPRDGVAALSGLSASLCVSFSGLKTSLLRFVQQHDSLVNPPADAKMLPDSPFEGVTLEQARVVASYQEAIVQSVAERTRFALGRRDYRALILGGGVSLNSRMRTVLSSVARRCGVPLLMAKPKYCGDNGAMIAGLAFYRRAHEGEDALRIDVRPSLEAGES